MKGVVGIRGAAQATANTEEAIHTATQELLVEMVERNAVDPESLVAIWFTQTPDLTAAHAPAAARRLGWRAVPLLGGLEADVSEQLPRVVRALMLAPDVPGGGSVRHVYLGATRSLRPDLEDGEESR
jgi:chorismate mutase